VCIFVRTCGGTIDPPLFCAFPVTGIRIRFDRLEPVHIDVLPRGALAFFAHGNGQCDVQAVIWNANDTEAKSVAGVRLSLEAGNTAAIDSSASESFSLRCGDHAETLKAVDNDQRFVSQQFARKGARFGQAPLFRRFAYVDVRVYGAVRS